METPSPQLLEDIVAKFTGADKVLVVREHDSSGMITYINYVVKTENYDKLVNDEYIRAIDSTLSSSSYFQNKYAQIVIQKEIMLQDIERLEQEKKELEKYKTFYELYKGLK